MSFIVEQLLRRDKERTHRSDIAMKNILMAVLCAADIFISGCSTLHNSDSAALQGTWKGYETGLGTEAACSLTISGNVLDFRGADKNDWCKGTFTIREDTNPRQIVGTITECPDSGAIGKTVHAIYRIEASTLTITGNAPGDSEVPVKFEAPGARTFVLKKY